MVSDAETIRFIHPQTGDELAKAHVAAKRIRIWTTGATPTYVICGEKGLQLLQTGPEHIVTLTQIQAEACTDAVSTEVAGQRLIAVARNQTIQLLRTNGDGDWEAQKTLTVPNGSKALLARSDHALLAGWTGGQTLTEMSHRGLMEIPTGGPVSQVAYGSQGWMWSLNGQSAIVSLNGLPQPTHAPIVEMVPIELDGRPGQDIWMKLDNDEQYVLIGDGSWLKLNLKTAIDTPQAQDVDGDGCPELFSLEHDTLSVFYGGCNGAAISVPSAPTATSPRTTTPQGEPFKLGHDVEYHAYVGQTIRLQLQHPDIKVERFAARGGPLWLKVSPTGAVNYKPTEHDIGQWELTILAWRPLGAVQRYPLVLKVHRTKETAAEKPPTRNMKRRSRTYTNIRLLNNRLAFGLGASLGFSEARNSWALLGTDWVVSGSPHLSIQLDNPEPNGVWWSLTGETAPWFRYLTENMEMIHYLSTMSTVGWSFGEKFQAGVFGQAGFFITAVGARARWFPIHEAKTDTRHGVEFRLSWLPSNSGIAGYGALFYVVRLPKGL